MSLKSLMDRLFGRHEKDARSIAKDRLQFVLLHDRADIPPAVMDEIRREILQVLSKHIEIDEASLDVSLERADNAVALIANVPIRRVL